MIVVAQERAPGAKYRERRKMNDRDNCEGRVTLSVLLSTRASRVGLVLAGLTPSQPRHPGPRTDFFRTCLVRLVRSPAMPIAAGGISFDSFCVEEGLRPRYHALNPGRSCGLSFERFLPVCSTTIETKGCSSSVATIV